MPPELASIHLTLAPSWDRDVEAAGTISRHIEVLSRGEQATFVVHYGYDAPGAPTNREAYKVFLGEQKLLTVTLDRQLGAAWYLEGTDAAGKAAFRFLVSYGGKRLVCFGSLYRESSLGDIRDQVMNEAKSICETLQL